MGKPTDGRLFDTRYSKGLIDQSGVLGEKGKQVFSQSDMFRLRTSGLLPLNEHVMGSEEHRDAFRFGISNDLASGNGWRIREYGVYKRGNVEIGDKVVWVEMALDYTFEIPDVKHPRDPNKGLRKDWGGVLIFSLDALQYNTETRVVSVVPNFNPSTDVFIRYPGTPVALGEDNRIEITASSDSLFQGNINLKKSDEYEEGATGYHGSFVRPFFPFPGNRNSMLWLSYGLNTKWAEEFGVSVVGKFSRAFETLVLNPELFEKIVDPYLFSRVYHLYTDLYCEHNKPKFGDMLHIPKEVQIMKAVADTIDEILKQSENPLEDFLSRR